MQVSTTWSKAGEPVGSGTEPIEVPKSALRTSPKGAVYLYLTTPVVVTDDDGRPIVRTSAGGSLILRAAPVLD